MYVSYMHACKVREGALKNKKSDSADLKQLKVIYVLYTIYVCE